MKPSTLKTILAIAAAATAYLFLSEPGTVVVSANGEISGLANNARETLQGSRFWRDQLKTANKELQDALDAPARDAALRRELTKLEQEIRQESEDMYRKYPDLRPSPAEQKAESLRDAADRIEQAELDRLIEEHRLKRIARLQEIILTIRARAGL